LKEQAEASGANLSPEELNIIRKQVDKNHRRGSGAQGEKMLEEEKDIREQEEENQTETTKLAEFGSTEEPSETNANIEEKEIDKERQRLGLKIDRAEDELLKEKFPEENNSEEEEENKEE
ncbi:5649_t:CDS:2, partial [Cetraspora pellucida]